MTTLKQKILNATFFQFAWFATVAGAARGWFWAGPLAAALFLAVHLAQQKDRSGEAKLIAASAALGFLFDTAFASAGIFLPLPHLFSPPFSPPWLISLWIIFAATINVSLSWLRGRYLLASLLGAVGGSLAYLGGAKLGAALEVPSLQGTLLLAFGWAVATPLLFYLSSLLSPERERTRQYP